MINSEWEEFFGIETAYDSWEEAAAPLSGTKKDAVSALLESINTKGCVDIAWMREASGLSHDELTNALEGAIFQDPEKYDINHSMDQGWLLRPQYLSGNIKAKLETAEDLNRKYRGLFEANILALKSIMPEKIDIGMIGFSLGSSWVPELYYAQFAKELLGLRIRPDIHYSSALGRWKVKISTKRRYSVQNVYTYGTSRVTALQILETTLNGGTVKIYDDVPRPDLPSGSAKILNKAETLAAQEKQDLLQKAFQEWVRNDKKLVKLLEDIFYNTYACTVSGRYNGSFLELPDLDKGHFDPYPHQKNAVARIILEKDVLLNHKVGTGKTGIIIMGMHERKRIGLSEKNLVVVPNNVLEAFERTHRQIYPDDRILVISPKDFGPKHRMEALAKIRDGDYTAIYMAFSSFEMIRMSWNYKLGQQEDRIRDCKRKAEQSTDIWERDRLRSKAARLKGKLKEMKEKPRKDEYIPFEELGITSLVIDEAHNFKNVSIESHADYVVGMNASGSSKCNETLEKVQFVRSHGGGVIFSTGTPLTNSISDLYVLQHYLQPEQLEFLRLDHFDEWINNFATRQTGFEVDVDSQNYRVRTRFSSFHNIPELTSLFSCVCDFYSGSQDVMDLPESEGYEDVIVPKSAEQRLYIKELVERTEGIRQRQVRSKDDNLLKVTNDGRAAALDIRLANPEAKPYKQSTKVYACAEKVYNLWKSFPGTSQLIFSDIGTPKDGFNVYDELKTTLIRMGVPEAEISFVHNAQSEEQKRRLFKAVNEASVRILIGSTSKLGTGVNVQEHLIAIHHLDIPWKPADIMQREGRLIRQGNTNARVFRFRYITAGTFDAYSWQLLENKQRFISQFMSNSLACRDARDIDDTVLSYAEIKALSVGDPLLKDRIDTSNELERLRIHCRKRDQELRKLESVITDTPSLLNRLEEQIRCLEQDQRHYQDRKEKLTKPERISFGEEALAALEENIFREADRLFDNVHGFDILLPAYMKKEKPYLLINGISGKQYHADMKDAVAAGCIQRIEHVLSHLDEQVAEARGEIDRAKAQASYAEAELGKGNSYTEQVANVSKKLLDIDAELNRRANEGNDAS